MVEPPLLLRKTWPKGLTLGTTDIQQDVAAVRHVRTVDLVDAAITRFEVPWDLVLANFSESKALGLASWDSGGDSPVGFRRLSF